MKQSFILFLTLLFISCNSPVKKSLKPIISVSILPEKYFVEQILGNDFEINVAIASGASHADYDPTPSEMTAIHKSVAYFKIGQVGFEYTTLPRLCSTNSNIKIYDLSKGIDFENSNEHHCCEYHGVDPHIWLSPKMVKIVADNIYQAGIELNPEKADAYKENLLIFLQRLDSLDVAIKTQLDVLENRSFMIYHPALTYYARDYNLEQISIELEGKEPTGVWMQNLLEQVQDKKIKLIFIQYQYDMNNAKAISDATGSKLAVIDPMAEDWLNEMGKITKFLIENR